MASFEEWENDDYFPEIQVKTAEQLQRIRDQECAEESEKKLIADLFSDKDVDVVKDQVTTVIKKHQKTMKKPNKHIMVQKETSQKIKESKLKKQREQELFGETTDHHEYQEYEDMFYH